MSKLSDIQTMCKFCGNAPALDETCLQRIKDVMVSIAENEILDPVSLANFIGTVENL